MQDISCHWQELKGVVKCTVISNKFIKYADSRFKLLSYIVQAYLGAFCTTLVILSPLAHYTYALYGAFYLKHFVLFFKQIYDVLGILEYVLGFPYIPGHLALWGAEA